MQAYGRLLFLADKNKPRKTLDTEVSQNQQIGDSEVNKDTAGDEDKEREDVPSVTKSPKEREFRSPKLGFKRKRGPLAAPPITTPLLNEALNVMKSIQNKKEDAKDEYSLFSEQIAIKIRKLNSPQARFAVQNAINHVLYEAEIGMYNPGIPQASCSGPNTAFYSQAPYSYSHHRPQNTATPPLSSPGSECSTFQSEYSPSPTPTPTHVQAESQSNIPGLEDMFSL
ncbi:uncharacterized protein LOC130899840 [Diorhabda carinulata]|uniref:uncharacterized protein LOC130899840 n=1 Tax=Diorhabda carinulata TaxID=1163345 RepID=UPI0025A15AB3|nr:uncharacterized protein LOC130899840 [Diorhabda carinulata]